MATILAATFSALYSVPRETYAQNTSQYIAPMQIQYPPAVSAQLNVPFCDQDESVNNQHNLVGSCWDASAEMILNYWHSQAYLASVPSQNEIYLGTMSFGAGGSLNAELAALGFYSAACYPLQTDYASYNDYQQASNAFNATQMIYQAQAALSLGVPLEATVETQPYPQANASTGGIICDSRGPDHSVVITGYNQTGFIFNSATSEKSNPAFVTDDRLNTYSRGGQVVNGYMLYCPYQEFIDAYNQQTWSFNAIFPLNYSAIMRQQTVQLLNENKHAISGMLVSCPFSSATTDSEGYATLTITLLGTPMVVGSNMQTNSNGTYCGSYSETHQLNCSFSEDYGIYMLYPTTSANLKMPPAKQILYFQ